MREYKLSEYEAEWRVKRWRQDRYVFLGFFTAKSVSNPHQYHITLKNETNTREEMIDSISSLMRAKSWIKE